MDITWSSATKEIVRVVAINYNNNNNNNSTITLNKGNSGHAPMER